MAKPKDLPKPLMSRKEIALMKKIIRKFKSSIDVAVELGSFEGGTSIAIVELMKKTSTLYCVDSFVVNGSDARPRFINDVLPNFKNMILIESATHDASASFDKPIDFLFIDACHENHGIQEDLRDWLPKVKSGGVVAFHDYNNELYPHLSARVDEATVGWEMLDASDTLAIKIKP